MSDDIRNLSEREQYDLLALYGFHEFDPNEGLWRYGSAGTSEASDASNVYTLAEALAKVQERIDDE